VPATSGGDAEAARDASGIHSPAAEAIEEAMPGAASRGQEPDAPPDGGPHDE
jgi:hypothetical protein